jgi:hypothetical protein
MPGLRDEFPNVLRGGDDDNDGGARDAEEEENFQQAHAEENDGHGISVPRHGVIALQEAWRFKGIDYQGQIATDGRLRLA